MPGGTDAIAASPTPPAGYTGIVYYITDANCVFSVDNGSIPMNGDIAVVATGGIDLGNHPIYSGVGRGSGSSS